MAPDIFNLQRELIIVKSGVRNIFTPHKPIQSIDLFLGRGKEVGSLIEHLNTPGQHALLFGSRGVGKSSLANISCDMILQHICNGTLYKKRCDSTDNFSTLFLEPLKDAGVDLSLIEETRLKSEGGKAGVSIPGLGAGVHTKTDKQSKHGSIHNLESPSWVAQRIAGLDGLFLIDETDALTNNEDRHKLAELVKHLSDVGSSLKLLLVGISETGSALTAGHPSVNRCLKETHLGRMIPTELKEIISSGEKKVNLNFTDTAKNRIVDVSNGYPHFTHLLALKAAEDAIASSASTISVVAVEKSTRRATGDAEGTLRTQYGKAIRSHQSDEYRKILIAASDCGPEEFSAKELRQKYKDDFGMTITQNTLNNYFSRLVSEGQETILRRLGRGVYRFNDPRMPSFIRMANMSESDAERSTSIE